MGEGNLPRHFVLARLEGCLIDMPRSVDFRNENFGPF